MFYLLFLFYHAHLWVARYPHCSYRMTVTECQISQYIHLSGNDLVEFSLLHLFKFTERLEIICHCHTNVHITKQSTSKRLDNRIQKSLSQSLFIFTLLKEVSVRLKNQLDALTNKESYKLNIRLENNKYVED